MSPCCAEHEIETILFYLIIFSKKNPFRSEITKEMVYCIREKADIT